jgi:choline dehydrogenase-like flavoprotein
MVVKKISSQELTTNSDHYEEHIQAPEFIGRDIGSTYDWNITTSPQTQLDGATRPIPLGRVVGGGSVINGMVWNRGNQDDYNAWQSLGNAGWAWNDILPYFKRVYWS